MSNKTSTSKSTGMGFLTLLGLLFIGLKLGGVITWSWWLVLLPLYGGFAIFLIFVLITLFIALIAILFKI